MLTPTRQQEASDAGEVRVCATQVTAQPPSAAKLAADVAERINEGINQKFDSLNAKFEQINGKFEQSNAKFEQNTARFEQKHDELLNMFQTFMEKFTSFRHTKSGRSRHKG